MRSNEEKKQAEKTADSWNNSQENPQEISELLTDTFNSLEYLKSFKVFDLMAVSECLNDHDDSAMSDNFLFWI